jgi:hypothetical protein
MLREMHGADLHEPPPTAHRVADRRGVAAEVRDVAAFRSRARVDGHRKARVVEDLPPNHPLLPAFADLLEIPLEHS